MKKSIIQKLAEENGMTRYELSKKSGIPWATLSDIYSGKTDLFKCTGKTLLSLSRVFRMTVDDMLTMDSQKDDDPNNDSAYGFYEVNLPFHLQKAIDDLKDGLEKNIQHTDCLKDEVYGSINSAMVDHEISEEQAKYLRSKYLNIEGRA